MTSKIGRAFLTVMIFGLLLCSASRTAFAALEQRDVEKLCAPIALYPDTLVANILAASTYPEEVSQAAAFVHQSGAVPAADLDSRLSGQVWDPSVKALTAFPDVLAMMTSNAGWASDLGNAFLCQQADVFRAIQALRAAAEYAGNLTSTPQEEVRNVDGNVILQPAQPGFVSVPYYDPAILYYWGPHPWYVGYGNPVGVDDAFFSGILDWVSGNMFFGQGYCGYYCHGPSFDNFTVIQNNIINHVGVWNCNPLHRHGLGIPTRTAAVSRAVITQSPLTQSAFGAAQQTQAFHAFSSPTSALSHQTAFNPSSPRPSSLPQHFAPQNLTPRFNPSNRVPYTPTRPLSGQRFSSPQRFAGTHGFSSGRSFSPRTSGFHGGHSGFAAGSRGLGHGASALGHLAKGVTHGGGGLAKAAGHLLKGLSHFIR